MGLRQCGRRAASVAALLGLAAAAMVAAANAQEKTYLMKITFPTLNDSLHQFAKDYAAAKPSTAATDTARLPHCLNPISVSLPGRSRYRLTSPIDVR